MTWEWLPIKRGHPHETQKEMNKKSYKIIFYCSNTLLPTEHCGTLLTRRSECSDNAQTIYKVLWWEIGYFWQILDLQGNVQHRV